jgi:DNA-binding transcriptional LysR family regulator
MDDLQTRELRYFVAVAEELHFGRAAQRLGIAQPPLSRAISQLERRMGVALLTRGSRALALTRAGEVLLHEGRRALDAVAGAGRRAQRAGDADPRLVLVLKAGADGGLLPDILSGYAAQPDALRVEVVICGIAEQAPLLRQGRADVALLHPPYDETSGFDTEELLIQGQVAVLPEGHRLAGRPALLLDDLRGETMPRWPGSEPAGDGPLIRDSAQLMQLIALRRTVAVLPESVRAHLRRDLVAVPVTDAPLTRVVLAWPAGSRSRALAAFVRAATEVAQRRCAPVAVG